MPVKVLHLITRLIVGGAQENTLLTAAHLDPRRYRVDVISGPQTGSEGSLIEEAYAQGIRLSLLPELVRQVSPQADLLALVKLARHMRREGYTIVHTHSSKAGILGRLAARLAGVAVIVHTVHGWSFHDHMRPATRRAYILLERWAARHSQALVVVAQADIHKGLQHGIGQPEQYHLVRSAIPLAQFHPAQGDRAAVRAELGLPPDAPVLGNVGRFSAQKNPLEWVQVAGQVAQAVPGCHFLMAGDGPLRLQVEAALDGAGLRERSVLPGLRRDVPRLLSAMDVFLLTSLWEGLPRVLPQAMAMGLPVVANRADGTVEAVQDGQAGYLCDPGDIAGLAAACQALLADPERARRMGAAGQAYARTHFDLQGMIAQLEALYARLLA